MLLMLPASLALFLWAPACAAQTVQDDWVFPQGPDYSTILQLGKSYTLQWTSALQGWFPNYCSDCNPTSVDLWITGSSDDAQHKIAAGVDVTSTLSVTWTATIPAAELSNSKTWVFRFLPKGEVPTSTSQQISSNIFIINDPDATSSSSSPTSSSTTVSSSTTGSTSQASSTSPTTTSSAAGGTETSTPPPSSSGLSTGAKAGVGVGVSVGAIALFGLGWFLARRHGSKGSSSTPAPNGSNAGTDAGKPPQEMYGAPSQEMYGAPSQMTYSSPSHTPYQNMPHELHSQAPVEVP